MPRPGNPVRALVKLDDRVIGWLGRRFPGPMPRWAKATLVVLVCGAWLADLLTGHAAFMVTSVPVVLIGWWLLRRSAAQRQHEPPDDL